MPILFPFEFEGKMGELERNVELDGLGCYLPSERIELYDGNNNSVITSLCTSK